MRHITIGTRVLGAGSTYLIAEAGVNHNGDPSLARDLVDLAADAGADAVKFQMFMTSELSRSDAPTAAYQAEHGDSQAAMLRSLELEPDAFIDLAGHARSRGVEFLCTPFSIEAAAFLIHEVGVNAVKVSSGDLTYARLLRFLDAEGVPVLLSTGMATTDEVAAAIADLSTSDVVLFHCVSQYPAPPEEANLRRIDTLRSMLGDPVGFSDHFEDVAVSLAAVARGASVVERHYTLDRALPGPDHRMSMDPDSLVEWVARIRGVEALLGHSSIEPVPSERDTRAVARRSVVATRNLEPGSVLADTDVVELRPDDGISARRIDDVVGAVAATAIRAGEPLSLDALRPGAGEEEAAPKRIAVVTSGRQDYGLLRSTMLALEAADEIDLSVIAGGMHLSPRFGSTVRLIESEGIPIAERVAFVSEPPDAIHDTGTAVRQFGEAFARVEPDAIVLLGDRYETLAAAVAATLGGIPIVHIHGGEETEGAIDNAMRHAITKLAHLHLVSSEEHARRVRQLGEPPETVIVVGAPGLDNAHRNDLPDRTELADMVGIDLEDPLIVVTVHPTTLASTGDVLAESRAIATALSDVGGSVIVTRSNADDGGEEIHAFWAAWVEGRERAVQVDALGERAYWGALNLAAVVIGNSSSGIIEAPEAGAAVVDVGDRQKGRERHVDVISVPADDVSVGAAVERAIERGRAPSKDTEQGLVADRILDAISGWSIPPVPRKRFWDVT